MNILGKWLLLLQMSLLVQQLNAHTRIIGSLEGKSGQTGRIYAFVDYISRDLVQIGEFLTDEMGNFHVDLDISRKRLLLIDIGRLTLMLHVENGGEYSLKHDSEGILVIEEKYSELNSEIEKVDLFISNIEKEYLTRRKSKLAVGLQHLRQFSGDYQSEGTLRDIVLSKIFRSRINFLQNLKLRADADELKQIDEEFQKYRLSI